MQHYTGNIDRNFKRKEDRSAKSEEDGLHLVREAITTTDKRMARAFDFGVRYISVSTIVAKLTESFKERRIQIFLGLVRMIAPQCAANGPSTHV